MEAGPDQSSMSLENLVFGAGYCKPTSSEVRRMRNNVLLQFNHTECPHCLWRTCHSFIFPVEGSFWKNNPSGPGFQLLSMTLRGYKLLLKDVVKEGFLSRILCVLVMRCYTQWLTHGRSHSWCVSWSCYKPQVKKESSLCNFKEKVGCFKVINWFFIDLFS